MSVITLENSLGNHEKNLTETFFLQLLMHSRAVFLRATLSHDLVKADSIFQRPRPRDRPHRRYTFRGQKSLCKSKNYTCTRDVCWKIVRRFIFLCEKSSRRGTWWWWNNLTWDRGYIRKLSHYSHKNSVKKCKLKRQPDYSYFHIV